MFKKIIHRYILVAVLVVALFGALFIASALPEGVSKAIKSYDAKPDAEAALA